MARALKPWPGKQVLSQPLQALTGEISDVKETI